MFLSLIDVLDWAEAFWGQCENNDTNIYIIYSNTINCLLLSAHEYLVSFSLFFQSAPLFV
jgi:hypothetical protein